MTPNEVRELARLLGLAVDMASDMRRNAIAEGPASMLTRATWAERLDHFRAARQSVNSIISEGL